MGRACEIHRTASRIFVPTDCKNRKAHTSISRSKSNEENPANSNAVKLPRLVWMGNRYFFAVQLDTEQASLTFKDFVSHNSGAVTHTHGTFDSRYIGMTQFQARSPLCGQAQSRACVLEVAVGLHKWPIRFPLRSLGTVALHRS